MTAPTPPADEVLAEPLPPVRRRLVGVVPALLLVAFLAWGALLSFLTGASKSEVASIVKSVTNPLVERNILSKQWHRRRPQTYDLWLHFAFYAPMGAGASLAGLIAYRRRGKRVATKVFAIVLGVAFLWPAADEFHQRWVPSRTAGWDDLLAGWVGVSTGAFVGGLLVLTILWLGSRRPAVPLSSSVA